MKSNLQGNQKSLEPSIIIRAFNEEEHIGRLLTGIMKQTVEDPEIVLVDSGSSDATRAIASQYPVKIVHIDPAEFTFGRSLNRGIEAASGDIMVIISAHCYPVYPDWLEKLIAPFENPQVAAAYGKQRGGASNHFSEHQFFRTYFPNISQPAQKQPYMHNANSAIRKSLWVKNPFDEGLTGIEDIAWSSWVREEGFLIAYIAEAEVIHLHDETMAQVHNRYRREAIAMKQILPQSEFSLKDFLSHWIKKSLSDLAQARREGVLFREFLNVIMFRLMQYWGTYRGYAYSGKIDTELHHQFYYPPSLLNQKHSDHRELEPIQYQDTLEEES